MAIQFLIEEKLTSVKLVSTRCLIKFSRKIKSDQLMPIISVKFEEILDQLTGLLDSPSLDTIFLPIEAFT
jgi:hypothetical protein